MATVQFTTDPLPPCPWCRIDNHVRMVDHRHFYCGKCKREFDGVDDGDISYGRPDRRIERQERQKERNKLASEGQRLAWARRKAAQR